MNQLCPYCGKESALVNGDEIYPGVAKLEKEWYYECLPCNAYVGCHKGTKTPLGILADPKLRELRQQCHRSFDRIWKNFTLTRMSRRTAYIWLAYRMRIPHEECHIGLMGTTRCKNLLRIVAKYKKTWSGF